MRKKLDVLLIFDTPYSTDRGHDFKQEFKDLNWMTEDDVFGALTQCGHNVRLLGLYNDITPLLDEIKEKRPDIVFNLAEVFDQKSLYDKNVVCLFELLKLKYTGATPASLIICGDKALTKKILSFHRIKVPKFHAFYLNHKVWLPKRLKLPIIVKPLQDEASRGISQASVVDTEAALIERVGFIHESMKVDAIAEEYIDGREFYVTVLGNKRITAFPLREMKFGQFPEDEPRIATYKAKWDFDYRQKWGIKNVYAGRLVSGLEDKIFETCKRAYRALNMNSYARFDIRVTSEGIIYIIEANANPCLARYDELGQSAEKAGITYPKLIQKIINLALEN
ncbi:MAG: ATP-grasp domain-containing protein [Candidatus Omnitrophica bacterium]|nr:ATP-grasp domain-containing protein [Candidatus Omnitrophota bacterium]